MNRWRTYDPTSPAAVARKAKYASAEHKAARAYWKPLVEAGQARCWRCGTTLVPGRWVVGHDDVNVNVIRGPECVWDNNRAGARKGKRVQQANSAARSFVRVRR